MEIEKKNLEPGISPTKRDPASREDLESGIMNLESGNKGQETPGKSRTGSVAGEDNSNRRSKTTGG